MSLSFAVTINGIQCKCMDRMNEKQRNGLQHCNLREVAMAFPKEMTWASGIRSYFLYNIFCSELYFGAYGNRLDVTLTGLR
jgi:hypothetical protein